MRIIEIEASQSGGHRNQTGHFKTIPEGWAVIPEKLDTPNFHFGEAIVQEVDGVMTVTSWKSGTLPEPESEQYEPTEIEQLRADVDFIAVMTGVDL